MNLRLNALLLISALVPGVAGAGDAQALSGDSVCPPLMTERECTAFINTLASLPAGGERDMFLLAHDRLMREREKACSCGRLQEAGVRASSARHRADAQARIRY
jgi:hypothetical protein